MIALIVQSAEAAEFARELVEETGESLETAVTIALLDRLRRERGMLPTPEARLRALRRIAEETSKLPVLDDRPIDVLLGYAVDDDPAA